MQRKASKAQRIPSRLWVFALHSSIIRNINMNISSDDKIRVFPFYGKVLPPCQWYARQISKTFSLLDCKLSTLAYRIIKATGLLLIAPGFALLGIALTISGQIASAKLIREKDTSYSNASSPETSPEKLKRLSTN